MGGGVSTLEFLKKHLNDNDYFVRCFADNNPLKQGTFLSGIPVMSCQEAFRDYQGELVLISCGEGDEIIQQLKTFDVREDRIFIPDVSVIGESDAEYIKKHIPDFALLFDELSDEKSKDVLMAVLNYKIAHDIRYIKEVADASEDQYFDNGIISFNEKDIFLDCGAYTGDTIQQYLRHNSGIYQSVICVEADSDNCGIIRKMLSKHLDSIRGTVCELACWNEKANLVFDKIGSGSGTLDIKENSDTEKIMVQADTIDHILGGDRVSFIKMDIEGAEYKALLGAVDTIQKWNPALMISAYHKQSDLLRLSSLIKSLNEDYKLYLRHYRSMSVQETVLYATVR